MSITTGTTGFGTLLKMGNGATSETFANVAEVRSIQGPGFHLDLVDATHMESPSGFKEWLPTLKDGGEVQFEVNYLPANSTQQSLTTAIKNRTKKNWKVVWPNTAATAWLFAGFVTDFSPNAPLAEMLTASCTIKITGDTTIS